MIGFASGWMTVRARARQRGVELPLVISDHVDWPQVTQTISDLGGNIDALNMVAREGARDFYDVDITLEVHDLKHLNDIMASLRGKPAVSDVSRKTG